MKKTIIIVVLVGMLGWAVYDFFGKAQDTADPENTAEADQKQSFDIANDEDHENTNDDETKTDEDDTSSEEPLIGLEEGNAAPDFDLETLEGGDVSLSDYRGERVLLNFWATWCPPCRAEMPDLEKFNQNNDVTILAVNLTQTEDDLETIEDFIDEYDATFPILLDEDVEVAGLYGIQPIPTSYMIDSDGIIRKKVFGALQYDMMVSELDKMN